VPEATIAEPISRNLRRVRGLISSLIELIESPCGSVTRIRF
jgi:hypothetical protein